MITSNVDNARRKVQHSSVTGNALTVYEQKTLIQYESLRW